MNRFDELIIKLCKEYSDDWWIKAFSSGCSDDEVFQVKFDVYRNALDKIDEKSWGILKNKATESFKQNLPRRGKNQFFNLLNEALAYEYLVESGRTNVCFIEESQEHKTPDLSFCLNERNLFCEVKSIGISDAELSRYDEPDLVDNSVYSNLGKGFYNKLSSTIDKAISQLPTNGTDNLIYIKLEFDDFVGWYYEKYVEAIRAFLKDKYPKNSIYIRIGIEKRTIIDHSV